MPQYPHCKINISPTFKFSTRNQRGKHVKHLCSCVMATPIILVNPYDSPRSTWDSYSFAILVCYYGHEDILCDRIQASECNNYMSHSCCVLSHHYAPATVESSSCAVSRFQVKTIQPIFNPLLHENLGTQGLGYTHKDMHRKGLQWDWRLVSLRALDHRALHFRDPLKPCLPCKRYPTINQAGFLLWQWEAELSAEAGKCSICCNLLHYGMCSGSH